MTVEVDDPIDLLKAFKQLEGTDTQVESGIRCYRKPFRSEPRHFSAQDAARVMCYAVKAGSSEAEILRRFKLTCGDEQRDRRTNTAEEAMAAAAEQLQATNALLLQEWQAFLLVNGLLLGVIALLGVIRLAGPLRLIAQPLRTAARVAQTQVATILTRNVAGRAANDAVFEQLVVALRQAA